MLIRAALILLALLPEACMRVDVDQVPDQTPLAFSTYGRKRTKADASYVAPGQDFAAGAVFRVYGFLHEASTWEAETAAGTNIPDFMYGTQVTKQSGGGWTYSPIKYWPNEYEFGSDPTSDHTDRLSFWGYYPSGAANLNLYKSGTTTAYDNDSNGLPSISFTQGEDPATQVDLMFSEPIRNIYKTQSHTEHENTYTYGALTDGHVLLTFRHALSLVEFRLREGTGATVNSMSLTELKKSGVCADPSASPLVWDTSGSATYNMTGHNVVVNDANVVSLILMPQDISANSTFTLNYDIRFASSDGTEDIVYKGDSFSVKLWKDGADAYGVKKWEPGHHYIYWISAGLDRIEFEEVIDASADSWTLWTDPYDSSNHDIDVQ